MILHGALIEDVEHNAVHLRAAERVVCGLVREATRRGHANALGRAVRPAQVVEWAGVIGEQRAGRAVRGDARVARRREDVARALRLSP